VRRWRVLATGTDRRADLEAGFVVRTVSLHTASERHRMVNPRKAYPIDPALISLYERTGRANLGHALEIVVPLELEGRACETDYVRTRDRYEVDFFARNPEGGCFQISFKLLVSRYLASENGFAISRRTE
jgi:predicted AAA+ superfamily ATPase